MGIISSIFGQFLSKLTIYFKKNYTEAKLSFAPLEIKNMNEYD